MFILILISIKSLVLAACSRISLMGSPEKIFETYKMQPTAFTDYYFHVYFINYMRISPKICEKHFPYYCMLLFVTENEKF